MIPISRPFFLVADRDSRVGEIVNFYRTMGDGIVHVRSSAGTFLPWKEPTAISSGLSMFQDDFPTSVSIETAKLVDADFALRRPRQEESAGSTPDSSNP